MTAKEMFEELGYEDTSNQYHNLIRYVKASNKTGLEIEEIVCIELNSGEVQIVTCYGRNEYGTSHLTMKELKAINKQVEELGWQKNE